MVKNPIFKGLVLAFVTTAGWQSAGWAETSENPQKPQIHIFLPDGYCGEFVVFWGENTDPVDEPPEFLSYNIYPDHPSAALINLPEPYDRAGLRFLYFDQAGDMGRNPIFRRSGVTQVQLSGGVEVLENGHTRSLPAIDTGIAADIFTVGQDCESNELIGGTEINELYNLLTEDEN